MLFHQTAPRVSWLQTFAPLFWIRVWPYAQAPLPGASLAPGKRTASSILRGLGWGGVVHFQNLHRVLNRAQWPGLGAAQRLFHQLVQAQGPCITPIAPLPLDAALFAPAPARPAGRKGRPALKRPAVAHPGDPAQPELRS